MTVWMTYIQGESYSDIDDLIALCHWWRKEKLPGNNFPGFIYRLPEAIVAKSHQRSTCSSLVGTPRRGSETFIRKVGGPTLPSSLGSIVYSSKSLLHSVFYCLQSTHGMASISSLVLLLVSFRPPHLGSIWMATFAKLLTMKVHSSQIRLAIQQIRFTNNWVLGENDWYVDPQ